MAAGAAAAAYMVFESQWLSCREQELLVPGLAAPLVGTTILHLSDVHAGQPGLNLFTLRQAVDWAAPRRPDLVFLTGDILSSGRGGGRCLDILDRLNPRYGAFAVTGNHEYGLSKNPFAHRPLLSGWEEAGIVLLKDSCRTLEVGSPRGDAKLFVCGADYITGGLPLLKTFPHVSDSPDGHLSLLLVHRPPEPSDPLGAHFDVAFAGHTHGGQIRLPTPWGWHTPHEVDSSVTEGVHSWGRGRLVVSRGIGTTFLPLRLFTRPEAVLYRLQSVREDGVRESRPGSASDEPPSGIHTEPSRRIGGSNAV